MHLCSNAATSFEIYQRSAQGFENTFQDDLFQISMNLFLCIQQSYTVLAFQFRKPIDLAMFMWRGIPAESGREKERPQAVKVQANELHQFVECLKMSKVPS